MTALFVPALLWKLKNFGYIFTVSMNASLRLFWGKEGERRKTVHSRLNGYFYQYIGQYFLFGLIGTAIDLHHTHSDALKYSLAIIAIGLVVRVVAAYTVLSCCEPFSRKARLVVAFTWIAKATVQVALGGLVRDKERQDGTKLDHLFGSDFATLSVLAILISAPLGGVLGGSLAKRWLDKSSPIMEKDDLRDDLTWDDATSNNYTANNVTDIDNYSHLS